LAAGSCTWGRGGDAPAGHTSSAVLVLGDDAPPPPPPPPPMDLSYPDDECVPIDYGPPPDLENQETFEVCIEGDVVDVDADPLQPYTCGGGSKKCPDDRNKDEKVLYEFCLAAVPVSALKTGCKGLSQPWKFICEKAIKGTVGAACCSAVVDTVVPNVSLC